MWVGGLVKKIFGSIGYRVESDFLDSAWGKRLHIPIPLKIRNRPKYADVRVQGSEPCEFQLFELRYWSLPELAFTDDSTTPNHDEGNIYDTTTSSYNVSFAGRMNVVVRLELSSWNFNTDEQPNKLLIHLKKDNNTIASHDRGCSKCYRRYFRWSVLGSI